MYNHVLKSKAVMGLLDSGTGSDVGNVLAAITQLKKVTPIMLRGRNQVQGRPSSWPPFFLPMSTTAEVVLCTTKTQANHISVYISRAGCGHCNQPLAQLNINAWCGN